MIFINENTNGVSLNDAQHYFLNEVCKELKMSETEFFTWLLDKEFEKNCENKSQNNRTNE